VPHRPVAARRFGPVQSQIGLVREVRVDNKPVTVSIGVSCAQQTLHQGRDMVFLTRLLHQADLALYRAKSAGRNRTMWHDGLTGLS